MLMSGSIWWACWVLDGAGRPQHPQPGLLLGEGTRQQGHLRLQGQSWADWVMLSDPRALPHHHHQDMMLQSLCAPTLPIYSWQMVGHLQQLQPEPHMML